MHEVDYYELLGVRRNASPTEIKAAYRSLVKSAHPDAGGTAGMFHLLRTAYDTLADPDRRADYDDDDDDETAGVAEEVRPTTGTTRAPGRWRPRQAGPRRFGEDPGFVPDSPELDVASILWWDEVDPRERVRPDRADGPGHCPAAGALAAAVAALLRWTAQRYLALARAERSFVAEFGSRRVSGKPGTDADQLAERLTAALMARYLTRLPGVRIFHGLAWPGSVFADIDHAVLCGGRLVLIESKMWLPGHYTADGNGLRRNNRPFRGGGSRLPEGIAAYRELLPDVEVCGALVIYPSRDGEITTGEPAHVDIPPMTPQQFIQEIGAWLALEPSTVDSTAFRTVLRQVAGG